MTNKDIFKVWAPAGAKWIDWVRPLLFIAINDSYRPNSVADFTIPNIMYIEELQEKTAVIADLPSHDGVKEGLALSRLGFRPVPLYNGTIEQEGAMALVDNHVIIDALIWGALELKKINLPANAPPAFLLDSNRTHRYKMDASVFDNSWDIYDQDMPTAEYFLENGISKIILRAETVQKDLSRILYKLQEKGIKIFFTDGYKTPKEINIKKPPRKRK